MSDDGDSFTNVSGLLGDFLDRHEVKKVPVNEDFIVDVANIVLGELYPQDKQYILAKYFRQGELTISAGSPMAAQAIRLSTFQIMDRVNAKLPKDKQVEKIRVLGVMR
jgi:hypothetical protein